MSVQDRDRRRGARGRVGRQAGGRRALVERHQALISVQHCPQRQSGRTWPATKLQDHSQEKASRLQAQAGDDLGGWIRAQQVDLRERYLRHSHRAAAILECSVVRASHLAQGVQPQLERPTADLHRLPSVARGGRDSCRAQCQGVLGEGARTTAQAETLLQDLPQLRSAVRAKAHAAHTQPAGNAREEALGKVHGVRDGNDHQPRAWTREPVEEPVEHRLRLRHQAIDLIKQEHHDLPIPVSSNAATLGCGAAGEVAGEDAVRLALRGRAGLGGGGPGLRQLPADLGEDSARRAEAHSVDMREDKWTLEAATLGVEAPDGLQDGGRLPCAGHSRDVEHLPGAAEAHCATEEVEDLSTLGLPACEVGGTVRATRGPHGCGSSSEQPPLQHRHLLRQWRCNIPRRSTVHSSRWRSCPLHSGSWRSTLAVAACSRYPLFSRQRRGRPLPGRRLRGGRSRQRTLPCRAK
mmetsp:Transcript_91111/g.262727  ORF Transcript_91111/g.262727 Transcript_91111/m.262727 type:complete len:465 (+) Transcript_91111:579-1973(+)